MGRKTVLVPDLGGAVSVDVIELTLSNGDKISEEESILVLESDKATMDVPSPVSGSLIKYLVSEGDSVSVNDPIAEIEIEEPSTDELTDHQKVSLPKLENPKSEEISETPILDEAASIEVEKLTAENPKDNILDPNVDAEIDDLNYKNVHAGPAVRLLARDLGLDLSRVSGSGPKNRITKEWGIRYSFFRQDIGILKSAHVGSLGDLARSVKSDIPLTIYPYSREIDNPKQENEHHTLSLYYKSRGLRNLKWDLNYSYQSNSRKEYDLRRGEFRNIESLNILLQTHDLLFDTFFSSNENFAFKSGLSLQFQDNFSINH